MFSLLTPVTHSEPGLPVVSLVFGIKRLKSGLRAAKPSVSPYGQNIYRIEVKYIFLEIVHQGLSWEIFSGLLFFR